MSDEKEKCFKCGAVEDHRRSEMVILNHCDRCDQVVCECCSDSDYEMVGDPPAYRCTQWVCKDGEKCREFINLTLADVEDDTVFNDLFNDWQVKAVLTTHLIDEAALKTICSVWFNRGIARGTEWTDKEVVRLTREKS